tara:strand:- start:126 stop:467 length:342 start_codon:yes stop_codon:yes gene_type:complete
MFEYQKNLINNFQLEWKEKKLNEIPFEEEDVYAVEDCLSAYDVFYNPMSGKSCHSDSYMTCVSYEKLDTAIKEIEIPNELLDAAINYWLNDPNNQIPLKQVARIWKDNLTAAK